MLRGRVVHHYQANTELASTKRKWLRVLVKKITIVSIKGQNMVRKVVELSAELKKIIDI